MMENSDQDSINNQDTGVKLYVENISFLHQENQSITIQIQIQANSSLMKALKLTVAKAINSNVNKKKLNLY